MSSAQNKRVLALMRLPENSLCADCRAKDPRWASSKLGVFICINCSGIHRGLGTHITFVRSCTLDTWKPEEVDVMERVGNRRANEYWEARLPPDFQRPHSGDMEAMGKFLRQKYELKKWVDPLMRPPQIPEDVPWEPEPPQTYSTQFTDQSNDNQIPNEAPKRRKKKKNTENNNEHTDTFNDNNVFQDRDSENSSSFTEAKNKMKNNKKKFLPQNNIPIEHKNVNPSSDSLMSSEVPYNPNINTNNNISYEDNGFDPFSGKPLSKEKNYNADEDTESSEDTFADKIMGFIQNGIDFIKEKTKSKKKSSLQYSSGKMSENPRIPKQESIDALQPNYSNRPQFSSFEQQHFQTPPPPQNQQNHIHYQQFEINQNSHNDLGMKKSPQQQPPSADIFSMLDGSDVIVDDSFSGKNSSAQLIQNEPVVSLTPDSTTPNSQNPFLNEISKDNSQQPKQVQNNFNPFLNQTKNNDSPAKDNNEDLLGFSLSQPNDQEQVKSVPSTTPPNDTDEILGLYSPTQQQGSKGLSTDLFDISIPSDLPSKPQQGSINSTSAASDLFDLSAPSSNLQQPQQQGSIGSTGGYASDLFDLSVPLSSDTNNNQNQSTNSISSPEPKMRSSAYDVFERQGTNSSGGFIASPAGSNLGSLGLSPQQQQIAMRALQSQQRNSQNFQSPQMRQGSGNVFNYSMANNNSQNNFNASPAKPNKSGSPNQSSNDPFYGMNPF